MMLDINIIISNNKESLIYKCATNYVTFHTVNRELLISKPTDTMENKSIFSLGHFIYTNISQLYLHTEHTTHKLHSAQEK